MSVQGFSPMQVDTDLIDMNQKTQMLDHLASNKSGPNESLEDIRKAAQEFESFFIYYMIKVMRQTVQESSLFGERKGEKIYRSMLDEQTAHVLSERGGLGLSKMIERDLQLNKNLHSDDPKIQEITADNLHQHNEIILSPEKTRITSEFGFRRDPFTGASRHHAGIDLALPIGSPVLAAADGQVAFSGKMKGYGNVVILRHEGGMETLYAHNQNNELNVGDTVNKGDRIAQAGMSGRATGPHLHFEVRENGVPVEPDKYYKIQVQGSREVLSKS